MRCVNIQFYVVRLACLNGLILRRVDLSGGRGGDVFVFHLNCFNTEQVVLNPMIDAPPISINVDIGTFLLYVL